MIAGSAAVTLIASQISEFNHRVSNQLRAVLCLVLSIASCAAVWSTRLRAEEAAGPELLAQSSPFSAYLDLRTVPSGSPAQTVPAWIEDFEFLTKTLGSATAGGGAVTAAKPFAPSPASSATASGVTSPLVTSAQRPAPAVFRVRLQRPAKVSDDLQLRVFFEDRSLAERPCVTAWDELGTEIMRSSPLGEGLGLPTSETLTIPMAGVNYLEVETTGDGSQIRGLFFTWLEKAQIRQPIDFPAIEKVTEPFRVISAKRTRSGDSYLYGVVTAALQQAPLRLSADNAVAAMQFELERQPLAAIITYEVLGATVGDPPLVRVNSRSLGTADLLLPDLADPGYQGHAGDQDNTLGFHYTGWVRAQKVVPGHVLLAGLNELDVELSNGSAPVAIRAVDIQLKYNWEKLDYVLAPASNPTAR